MKYLFTFCLILILTSLFITCNSHSESPTSCMENPDAEGKLIVIVGEKIDITEVENPVEGLSLPYSKYIANYKILQKICGDYEKQNITFTAFDHYGFPAFGNNKQALLFLNKYKNDDTIYHVRYQYFPLYLTKDGRWASSYQYQEYSDETNVKPEKIEFAEEVSYSIEGMTRTTTQSRYPEPFYKIDKINKKAIAVWGNYVPELFQLKKDGVLKGRGYYGKTDPIISKNEIELENIEPIKLSKTDSLQLIKTLFSLLTAIKTNDSSGIKKMSFDSIICSVCEGMPQNYYENNFESINMFIDSANINFKKGGLWDIIQQNKFKIFATKYPERKPTSFSLGEKEKLVLYSIDIFKNKHSFIFVKVDNRFRLYAMESF
ncbi:MAG: hypothetical protein IPI78_15490 [Chitinophagaceae bacterium]|nr:hypothetical protein [Chitinophagaceae bacterium]